MPTDPEGRMMTIECSHSLALSSPDSSTQGRFRSSSNQLTTSAESVEFDMILPRVSLTTAPLVRLASICIASCSASGRSGHEASNKPADACWSSFSCGKPGKYTQEQLLCTFCLCRAECKLVPEAVSGLALEREGSGHANVLEQKVQKFWNDGLAH